MSINVGRGGTTQDIALARAFELGIDVVLIQEPLWNKQENTTKDHPGYTYHLPNGGENVRPRPVTYTRIDDKKMLATQFFPYFVSTGDYCWVEVNGITFLNVYKAPNDSTAIQPLINWTPLPNSVATGDFNSVYWAWQPGVKRPHGQGETIEKWAYKHHLTCHIIGEPTHRAGNTLDLVWSNVNGARAWVDHGECVTNNHFPIRGQIPVRNSVTRPEKAKLVVTKDKLPRCAKVIVQWVRPPPVLDTIERVEEYAEEICFHLTNAINAVGTRPKARCGRSAP